MLKLKPVKPWSPIEQSTLSSRDIVPVSCIAVWDVVIASEAWALSGRCWRRNDGRDASTGCRARSPYLTTRPLARYLPYRALIGCWNTLDYVLYFQFPTVQVGCTSKLTFLPFHHPPHTKLHTTCTSIDCSEEDSSARKALFLPLFVPLLDFTLSSSSYQRRGDPFSRSTKDEHLTILRRQSQGPFDPDACEGPGLSSIFLPLAPPVPSQRHGLSTCPQLPEHHNPNHALRPNSRQGEDVVRLSA